MRGLGSELVAFKFDVAKRVGPLHVQWILQSSQGQGLRNIRDDNMASTTGRPVPGCLFPDVRAFTSQYARSQLLDTRAASEANASDVSREFGQGGDTLTPCYQNTSLKNFRIRVWGWQGACNATPIGRF